MASIYYPSYTNLSYHPTGSGNANQVINIFYPIGNTPIGGWPVIFHLAGVTWGSASPLSTLASSANKRLEFIFRAIQAGIAVVSVGYTAVSASINGGGTFDPPNTNGDFEDDTKPNIFKDLTWAIQYCRYNATLYSLNPSKFSINGYTTTAIAACWPALGPDRADQSATDFRQASSKVQALVAHNPVSWFPAFNIGTNDLIANIFPDIASPLSGSATAMNSVPTGYAIEASPLYYGFNNADAIARNSTLPVYLNYDTNSLDSTDFSLNVTGYPSLYSTLTSRTDTWFGHVFWNKLLSVNSTFHSENSELNIGFAVGTGYNESLRLSATGDIMDSIVSWLTGMFVTPIDPRPEYWRDLYGDSTITYVPPVINYTYNENVNQRGVNDLSFRWQEVSIDLSMVQSGNILEFITPDYYMVQITPDLNWHDPIAMFGETTDPEIHNPHLKNFGPFSITNGTLIHNPDNSALVTLTESQIDSVVVEGYSNYVWRAVPWAQGNPGVGGLPMSFEWIGSPTQVKFTVDPIKKEIKKNVQVVSGTKGPRTNITVESENNPTVFIEQTSATWKVLFNIDRPQVVFTILATDEGGSAVSTYKVDIKFDETAQYSGHVWNAFDGFALLSSLERLPGETNSSLKSRIVDAFTNKGGTHYRGLVNGINRELGITRKDSCLKVSRAILNGRPIEPTVTIETSHTRISVSCPSFIIHDEVKKINSYDNTITLDKRIQEILSIKTVNNQEIDHKLYTADRSIGQIQGNKIKVDDSLNGLVLVTYLYKEDLYFADLNTIGNIKEGLNKIANPQGLPVINVVMDSTMTGSELSKYLYKSYFVLDKNVLLDEIGWSPIGLFSISDEEYKWSFANVDSLFFDSEFYAFVTELKSKTNIEWGFIIADKDYWDAVDADWYGRDSLPLALDIKLSNYVTVIPLNNRILKFDPLEAFRMGYYFDSVLIKNLGFPQKAFRSGVGYKIDCAVSVYQKLVSSQDTRINLNPNLLKPEDVFRYSTTMINSIAVDF